MKEFIETFKEVLEDKSKEKKEIQESGDTVLSSFKEDYLNENKEKLKTTGKIAIIVVIVLVVIGIIIFSCRKSIMNGIGNFIDNMTSFTEKTLEKNKDLISKIDPNNMSKDTCKNNYTGTYSGEYIINNQTFQEKLFIRKDGSYTKESNYDGISAGNYSINDNAITLNETSNNGISSQGQAYLTSNDCKTVTRYALDGTAIVLNIVE